MSFPACFIVKSQAMELKKTSNKLNYMSQARACLSVHEYTPRKLKELVATRFNIVGGCYDKNLEEYIICKKVAMTD
jgi:hypothetical protein